MLILFSEYADVFMNAQGASVVLEVARVHLNHYDVQECAYLILKRIIIKHGKPLQYLVTIHATQDNT